MKTTCQICGREIKAHTGLIAHHGYTRPGSGWQTASCFGARFRPYEVACDALPPAIESALRYRDMRRTTLAEWMKGPATITYQPKRMGYPAGDPVVYMKPAEYDVEARGAYSPRTYDGEFKTTRNEIERDIAATNDAIKAMYKRLTDWRAP